MSKEKRVAGVPSLVLYFVMKSGSLWSVIRFENHLKLLRYNERNDTFDVVESWEISKKTDGNLWFGSDAGIIKYNIEQDSWCLSVP